MEELKESTDIDEFEYELSEDGSAYYLKHYNQISSKATDRVVITSEYNDLPVIKIMSRAFVDCDKITCIKIPESIVNIEGMAFYGCDNLEEVLFSNGLTVIGEEAFSGCKIANITIPNTIDVGYRAFYKNDSLISVNIGVDEPGLGDIGDYAFYQCESLKEFTIGDGVSNIGSHAFYGCKNLEVINLPNGINNIEDSAFERCDKLETIYYEGTYAEWSEIHKEPWWDKDSKFVVKCSDYE